MVDEKELVRLAKRGDMKAFCELYDRYKDQMYRYAYYRMGNREDTEDVVQECASDAFRQIKSLKTLSSFRFWLFKILAGCCAKRITKIVRERQSLAALKKEVPKVSGDMSVSLELEEALNILNDTSKEIVLLSVIGGFTSEEVGRVVGLTAGSVRSNLSRSLSKMKNFLEGEKEESA